MKIIHLSDLHLGKRVNEFPMIEDQKYILKKIINIVDNEKADGVIIAGDIYDKSVPSAEAVELFDDFLVRLSKRKLQVYIISGNHDSPERLSFGNRLMDASGIHICPVYDGKIVPIKAKDEYGEVCFYMLPFVKPANVRTCFKEEIIESYTDAVRVAIDNMNVNIDERNVLITHQFVTGALRSESEDFSVGGADNIDASVFEIFDYVALGHIHGSQNINEKIRYCGTPLKYSFSEASHEKSVSIVEILEKGNVKVSTAVLEPLHDMVELKGKYSQLTMKSFYEGTTYQNDYIHITLTDEDEIIDAISKLRTIYPCLMKIDYDNTRTRTKAEITGATDTERKSPLDLFGEFYLMQNGTEMSDEQIKFVSSMIENVWESNV